MIVIDNAIPESYQNAIEQIVRNSEWNWKFNQETDVQYSADTGGNSGFVITDKTLQTTQMVHLLYTCDAGKKSDVFLFFMPIVYFVESKTGAELKRLIRAKVNMMTPNPEMREGFYNLAHVDATTPNTVLIYYPFDSDGDTVIFNEKYTDENVQSLTEKGRVTPKKGRIVLFDGAHFHTSTNPTKNEYRSVINFSFV
jgi:hypothetical protein